MQPQARLAAFALAAALAPAPALADFKKGDWEKVRDDDGIIVHRRKVEGSNLHEFRGRATVDASLGEILGVLYDVPHRTEWMERCVGSEVIDTIDERNAVFYNRTGAPWPVADRDVVLRSRIVYDDSGDPADKAVRINFESVTHDKKPPVDKVVRMPFLRGHWYLWPEDGGKRTRVEYQVHANPGGQLPEWLANSVSKQIPWKTIKGMRQQVARRDYSAFAKAIAAQPEYQALIPPAAAAPAPAAPIGTVEIRPPAAKAD